MAPERGLSTSDRGDIPGALHGIVVADGRPAEIRSQVDPEPAIAAFIWGGKVRPSPTLPFGRWKGAA